ncbi:MAG: hypothetical protein LAT82_05140 [Nanoarchaeota archaeon]|nr:hypothetical protein [Nanoarchaeota archaeon]
MNSDIIRETPKNKNKISILCENTIYTFKLDLLLKELSNYLEIEIFSIIRIKLEEYEYINTKNKYLTHFNLEKSGHKINKVYILPKIIQQGYFEEKDNLKTEILPILSFEEVLIYKCINCKEHISYQDLKKDDFKYSMTHISNSQELFDAIFKRYSISLPTLLKNDIYNRGVSLTTLEKVEVKSSNISKDLILKIIKKIQ